MTTKIKLSIEARNAVRKALTSHPRWNAYRTTNNVIISDMGRDDILLACRFLDIDVDAIAAQANEDAGNNKSNTRNEARAQRSTNSGSADKEYFEAMAYEANKSAKAEEAKAVFSDDDNSEDDASETVRTNDKSGTANKLLKLIAELSATSINEDDVARIVEKHIRKALENSGASVTIRLESNEWNEAKILPGHHHPKFPMMLKCAMSRDRDGFVPNIWITGPAASGKTHGVKSIAKALGVPFHSNGSIDMSHKLLGFIDANGYYHRTAFREAYEHGGVYLFDEVDGSDNAAILELNAALANGSCTFPDGVIDRHIDCRIFCTANTWGLGANADYVGRAKLDAAFLDRFATRFHWGYDNVLEQNICGNQEFAVRVQRARQKAHDLGIKVLITPRSTIAGAAHIANGFTSDEAADMTYLANLAPEQRRMIEAE